MSARRPQDASDSVDAAIRHAESHYKHKRFEQAREAYRQLLSGPSPQPAWQARLARVCERLKDWPAAVAAYRLALAGERADPEWERRMVLAQERIDRDLADEFAAAGIPRQAGVTADALERFQQLLDDAVSQGADDHLQEGGQSPLFRQASALCDQGQTAAAFAGLQGLLKLPGFATLGLRWQLQLGERYGLYDDAVLAAVREARKSGCQDRQARKSALAIASCWEGPGDALVQELVQLFRDDPRPRHLKVLAQACQLLFRMGDQRRLVELCDTRPDLLALAGQVPAIAWCRVHHASALGGRGDFTQALELLEAWHLVSTWTPQIWAAIGDAGHSLAIVGNSGRERGCGRGPEIDAHDRVVRFNNFSLAPPHDRDYGHRTSLVVRTCGADPKYDEQPEGADIVISGVRILDRYLNWPVICGVIRRGHRVAVYPPDLEAALLRRLRRIPSSGLSAVWIASALRGKADARTAYYGFSFVDQTGPQPESAHYYEHSLPSARHGWQGERELFEQITGRRLP